MNTTSALSINCTSYGNLVNIVNNGTWNDGVNYSLNVSGYSMFGGIQINGQALTEALAVGMQRTCTQGWWAHAQDRVLG